MTDDYLQYPIQAAKSGWDKRKVQWLNGPTRTNPCDHEGTDGSADCPKCRLPAEDFCTSAEVWLEEQAK